MPARAQRVAKSGKPTRCTEQDVLRATSRGRGKRRDLYALCLPDHAASRIHAATAVVEPGAVRGRTTGSGNTTSLLKMARGLFYSIFVRYPTRLAPARYIYNSLRKRDRWNAEPRRLGQGSGGRAHRYVDLNLEPGDLVRVKTHQPDFDDARPAQQKPRALLRCRDGAVRGGSIGALAGGSLHRRVQDRETMMSLKTPAVILEGAFCGLHLRERRTFCPRVFTRGGEVWGLERGFWKRRSATADSTATGSKTFQSAGRRSTLHRTEPDDRTANVAPPSKAPMTSLNIAQQYLGLRPAGPIADLPRSMV